MKNTIKILSTVIVSITLILSNNIPSFALSGGFDEEFFNLNNIIYYDATENKCKTSANSSTLTGNTDAEKIWNFLKSQDFTDESTAGIMGNFYAESGYDSSKIQSNGAGPAAGLAQWESWSAKSGRWLNMSNYAQSKGKEWTDLQSQLEWVVKELEGEDPTTASILKKYGGLDGLKKMTNIREAVEAFETSFERAGIPRWEVRYQAAEEAYASFAGKESSYPSPDKKITFIGDSLIKGVEDKLTATFAGSTVNAVVGRGISGSSSVLEFLNSNPDLNEFIVLNIGTNDNFPKESAKTMLDKLKDKKVYVVNNFSKNNVADFEIINSNINSVAKNYDNITILDWKSEVESKGDRSQFYESDGIHMNEEGKKLYVDFLKKSINGGQTSNTSSCGSGLSNGGSIADRAVELSWSEGDQRAYNKEVTDKQREALEKTGLVNYGEQWVQIGASCDAFVSMVMSTTVDPEFVKHCCGVVNLANYMRSNPDKYEKIAYNGTTDNMQPGDIMTAGTGGGAGAHIQIYVEINGEAKVANGGWSRTTGVIEPMNLSIMESLGPVEVFRWKG